MEYLAGNLRKYRMQKNLTQEDVADYLGITPQSVSKWERAECCPDITFLPALANIFETSVDLLLGMDVIRAEETRLGIHRSAHELMRRGDYAGAERVYRDALRVYPNKPGMILGLAEALALEGEPEEAIMLMERGLPLSDNEKQKATVRAALCFLYLKCGRRAQAERLAAGLPHRRESREEILPLIQASPGGEALDGHIRAILLGDGGPELP